MIQKSKMLAIYICMFAIGCSKSQTEVTYTPPPPVAPPAFSTYITLPAGWKYSSTLSSAYAAGMQVYTFDSLFGGKKVKAFAVAWDGKLNLVEMKPVLHNAGKRPSVFLSEETGGLACINGGFFGSNQSFSTVMYNGQVLSPNIKSVTRTFNGTNTPYFPTRAAMGIASNGEPSVGWIYHEGASHQTIYRYPEPSPNAEGQAPQPQPGASFPAGAATWNVQAAIGGSPMLIYNNDIKITDREELISINNTTDRPRSAIGYNGNRIIMMVAVEGDNAAAGYTGLSLAQLASFLKNLGLTNAINLDGGGSTSLSIGSQLTVRPGDNGNERNVVSAVILKRK
jgi:hypothetical protein